MTETYSPEEAILELEKLFKNDAAANALAVFARSQARKTRFGYHAYKDLIDEAVCRIIEPGRRSWSKSEPPLKFVQGVIRSIAWEWQEPWNKKEHPDYDRVPVVQEQPDPERLVMTSQLMEEFLSLFADDSTAKEIFLRVVDGLEGEELREEIGISVKEFNSKRRLIRRRIEGHLKRSVGNEG